jgi:hypothetical protein
MARCRLIRNSETARWIRKRIEDIDYDRVVTVAILSNVMVDASHFGIRRRGPGQPARFRTSSCWISPDPTIGMVDLMG